MHWSFLFALLLFLHPVFNAVVFCECPETIVSLEVTCDVKLHANFRKVEI